QLLACTRKQLADMARQQGITGWHGMRKEDLIIALEARYRKERRKHPGAIQAKPTVAPVQQAAARNTSPEEQVESSKYDVGVPTRALSARVPKDLPAGYGKDRIVLMVRDPYWLHTYWELTRHAVQRAEAALGQEWHGSRPILRLLDVTSNDTS